jgi:hypothetical protein
MLVRAEVVKNTNRATEKTNNIKRKPQHYIPNKEKKGWL